MRLIETSKLELWDVPENSLPRYAILSHTWAKEEITYADFRWLQQSGGIPPTSKIARSCKLALSEGWSYIWIDTCCIDKSSSAELIESINSMYRWYQNAGVCFVYMADVFLQVNDDPSKMELFGSSRWFTRGWTLQELLAPRHIIFYDHGWEEIGSKIDLIEPISHTTGVPKHCMYNHS